MECGGFSQAQAELGISRSTISTHMSNLETRLGLTLCRRGRSGFALTERGRLVYESASKFLTALEGFRSELGELQGRMTGEIKIGMVDNLTSNSSCKLYEVIDKFRAQTRDVHLIIQVVAPNQIDNWLTRGLLHLAIVANLPSSDAIHSETIFHERQELYCGAAHPLFDMDPKLVTKDIISQQDFVSGVIRWQRPMIHFSVSPPPPPPIIWKVWRNLSLVENMLAFCHVNLPNSNGSIMRKCVPFCPIFAALRCLFRSPILPLPPYHFQQAFSAK